MLQEREYCYLLSLIQGVGPRRYLKILQLTGSASSFWNLTTAELITLFGQNLGTKLSGERDLIDTRKELEKLYTKNEDFCILGEANYPQMLAEINDPPICLYYKGDISLASKANIISVVGTRKSSNYGENLTRKFVNELLDSDFTIVSGLAFGIDKVVHATCVERNSPTIAVMASPLDNITPPSHKDLAAKIIENDGLILSEYSSGTEVTKGNFPRRNRILAGLATATLVTEAPKRSGAMITASLAFEYNRQVFALPGDIGRVNSEGTHHLIKISKAKLTEKVDDILEELDINTNKKEELNKLLINEEIEIVENLKKGRKSFDDISLEFDIPSPKLIASLVNLEIKRIIAKDEEGNFYLI